MKHKKIIEIPAQIKEQVVKVTCDICRSEIKRGMGDSDEVTITRDEGVVYPDFSSGIY